MVKPEPAAIVSDINALPTVDLAMVGPFQLLQDALACLLKETRFKVAATLRSPADALNTLETEAAPALMLFCACAEKPGLVALVQDIRGRAPDIRLVVLTAMFCAQEMASYLDAGIDAYLVPDMSGLAFVHSLDLVMAGEKVFPTRLAEEVAKGDVVVAPAPSPESEALSERDREILACLVRGEPNKELARRFDLSEASVKMHLRQLFQKIGVSNRTQAATWALGNGFVSAA